MENFVGILNFLEYTDKKYKTRTDVYNNTLVVKHFVFKKRINKFQN